ncbi:MAG: CDP-glycerol glycerophosphotransferase family protein [Reichenbachiella sp.]|uniref:CDP-glycerol glycerophosphotransferase family protein n=1 Tax=Reichenbachiella sp. TaxID=2184521 RepID=UPI0032677960
MALVKKALKVYGLFLRSLQITASIFYKGTKPHIILGSSAGTNINGNSKALFLYMKASNTALKGYFITRNYSRYKSQIEQHPNHFLYAYSFKALYYCLTAKAYVITHGPYDITPFKITNTGKPLINLWHGTPLKKIGIDSHHATEKAKDKMLDDFDGFIVMSEEEREIISRCYRTRIENTWVTGFPRNDLAFVKNKAIMDEIPFIQGKRVLLYAPTFRDSGKTRLFPFEDFDQPSLIEFLASKNAVMLMRMHKNELAKHKLEENEWLRVCDGNLVEELNELMPVMDILITDYSSSYIDWLIKDGPSIFLPYDLEWYNEFRGFNFDYEEVTPGPKVYDFQDFLFQINRYLDDPSKDSELRQKVKARFHKYPDNHSSKRVYKRIETLLTTKS